MGGTGRQSEWEEEREREQENESKTISHREQERGVELQYKHGVFRFTFMHHPVPVRSLLGSRLGPDGNVGRQSGGCSEMLLGVGFQAGLAARQMVKRALHYKRRAVRGSRPQTLGGGETHPVLLHVE